MSLSFPNSPSTNDTHTTGGSSWIFDGEKWVRQGTTGPQGIQGVQGTQGVQGLSNQGVQGLQGLQGNQGVQGVQGLQGLSNQGVQGLQGLMGIQGRQGVQGSTGADGNFGGATFDYTFSSSATDSDPGQGTLRLNGGSAGLSAASLMFIDDEDDNGTDIQAFLRTIDDSTSTIKGHVRISNRLDASDFALFTISGTNTEATGYHKVNVSYVSGSASDFSNGEDIIVTFARTGTKGDTGATGSQGVQGLQGLKGSQGVQGLSNQGVQGLQGILGTAGSNGSNGAQGTTGTAGSNGSQGVQGATGTAAGGATGVDYNDNVKVRFGTGNDLEIYHDGTHSYIHENTGNLRIESDSSNSNDIQILNNNTTAIANHSFSYSAKFISGGSVELYEAGSKKLETKSDGVDVTGEVQCDSLDVDGAADITGNVTLHANLDLQDNDRLNIGSSDDFTIRHNGTDTHIENDTGTLFISSHQDDEDIALRTDDGSGAVTNYILCDGSEGNVRLYHYGTQKLGTNSGGIDVTGEVQCDSLDVDGAADITGNVTLHGNLDLQDNDLLRIGTGDDLLIHHNGTNSVIADVGTGNLSLQTNDSEINFWNSTDLNYLLKATGSGSVELYYAGTKKFETTSAGVNVTGIATAVTLYTSNGTFNAGGDTKTDAAIVIPEEGAIYTEDGVYLRTLLEKKSDTINIGQQNTALINGIELKPGNSSTNGVKLHFGGTGDNVKLQTTSAGVDITGDLTLTDTDAGSSAGPELKLYRNSASPADADYLGQIKFAGESDTGVERNYAKITGKISDASNGTEDGIIEFAHIKAGSQNISGRWNSTELQLLNGTHLSLGDSQEIRVGASDDLKIYHNGTHTFVENNTGGFYMKVANGEFLSRDGSEVIAKFLQNSAVELYYDNVKKLETKSDGVLVTGELQATTLDINGLVDFDDGQVAFFPTDNKMRWADSAKATFGNGDDLQLFHNGSHSVIDGGGTGSLFLLASTYRFRNAIDTEDIAKFTENGSVELYYDNSKKFETTSDGAKITGGLQDKDGQLGSSGQVLSSTGSQLNWVDADSGPQGVQGLKGTTGNTGSTGSTGSTGAQGIAGSDGTNGSNGSNGSNGAQGTAGSAGSNGSNGSNGAQGTAGTQGAIGPDGGNAGTLDNLDSSQFLRSDAADTASGMLTLNGGLTFGSSQVLVHNTTATRDKIRVWDSATYAIGFDNAMSFGGLNDYATTFQMNNDGDRGWVFLDNGHTDAQGAMSLTTNGKMCIAHSLRLGYGESDTTTPGASYRLDVSGNIYSSGTVTAASDITLKKNITTIDNALDKVCNLRGVEFDYIESGEHNIGVIAQEVEKVLPELVHTDNTKSVAYGNLTAVLIEAVKELKKENDALSARIQSLEDR